MSPWYAVWHVGMPLILVLWSAMVLSAAFSEPPGTLSRPRGFQWAWAWVWLMMAGEAAFGEDRSWFERACRGTAALLLAVAVTVDWWRHYQWRRRVRLAGDSPPPASRPPESGARDLPGS